MDNQSCGCQGRHLCSYHEGSDPDLAEEEMRLAIELSAVSLVAPETALRMVRDARGVAKQLEAADKLAEAAEPFAGKHQHYAVKCDICTLRSALARFRSIRGDGNG